MSNWFRGDVDFGVPWQTFRVGVRRARQLGLGELLRRPPAEAAERLEEHVAACIPTLVDCSVVGIHYCADTGNFHLDVVHPSLTRVSMLSLPEIQDLPEPGVSKDVCERTTHMHGKPLEWQEGKLTLLAAPSKLVFESPATPPLKDAEVLRVAREWIHEYLHKTIVADCVRAMDVTTMLCEGVGLPPAAVDEIAQPAIVERR